MVAGVGAVPWGAFVANVTGAGMLGYVTGRWRPGTSPIAAFVATGVLGAYTTFAALAVEVLALVDRGPSTAAVHGLGSLGAGLLAAAAGLVTGDRRAGDGGAR